MDYLTHQLLDKDASEKLVKNLLEADSSWHDGKKTAGSHASKVKNNYQLDKESKKSIELTNFVIDKLMSDALVKSYCLPKVFHGLMFSKSLIGQGYGMHVDNPYMSSGRSDLSFTLFLSDEKDYEGGELCIQNVQEDKSFKLPAGHIVIYPSTTLHAVEQISKGERIVCVGWIESYVCNNEDRGFLFSLDAGSKALLAKHGRSPELDLIFQSYSNILRRLGD
tara:strand:- start:13726 stop:14391 length:666 start_codon:yes stop_codon:yes gene_type:complete